MNEFIGVDIGGTNFQIGRVANGILKEESHVEVDTKVNEKELLSNLLNSIDSHIAPKIQGIGVGVPAVVDPLTGVVYDVQNIPAWREIPLKDILYERYNLPIFINNDANCFALGEKIFGNGKTYKNFIGLSIGTGLGMGIIINNMLYNGVLCGAGEIGMLPYKNGIFEDYSSSFFFKDKYKLSAKKLNEMAQNGSNLAINAFNEFGHHLGEAMKNILYMFAPEAIILGGSISKAYPYFKKSMESSLQTFVYQKQIEDFNIHVSKLPGLPILGAASLCMQEVNNPHLTK